MVKRFGIENAHLYIEANETALHEYAKLCQSIDCGFEWKDSYVYALDDPKKLEKEMENVEVHEMNIPIITNVTAEYINCKDDIKKLLKEQVSNSVLWEDSIRKMISDGVDTFIEIGPGKALSGFMKKIDKSMRVFNVEDMASLSNTLIGLRGE